MSIDFSTTSEEYLICDIVPSLRSVIRQIMKGKGFKLRGRGRVLKNEGTIIFTFDAPMIRFNPTSKLFIAGSYMMRNDDEYYILLKSPYLLSTHECHNVLKQDHNEDIKSILGDIDALLEDWKILLEKEVDKERKESL